MQIWNSEDTLTWGKMSWSKVKVLVTQSCPTFCDPMCWSPPGSSLHGISQAIILEWVPFSRISSWPRIWTLISRISGRIFTVWATAAAAAAASLQSCPTLCDPIDGSHMENPIDGSVVPGILQARMLEWVAISSSNAWRSKVKVKLLSHVQLFVTPWTAAYQAPPSMGFSRQDYWSGVPLPSLVWATREAQIFIVYSI